MRTWAKRVSVAPSFASVAAAVCGAAAGALLLGGCASCEATVRQTAIPVVTAGSFDGIEADQANHRIFLADRTVQGIDVIDVSGAAPRFAGTVDLGTPPNGLAYAPDRNRLFAGLEGGSVAVVDMDRSSARYLTVIDRVTVDGMSADLMDYSPKTGRVYVGTSEGGTVVAMDASNDVVMDRYDIKSPVGQPRYDPTDGKLYVDATGANALLQINPADGKVTRTYTLAPHCHPNGVAINPRRQLSLVTCAGSTTLIKLDTGLDEVSMTVPGGDIVAYDPTLDRFTIGSSHGARDSSIGVLDGQGQFIGSVAVSPNARGAVFDDASGLVYAVGAAGLLSFSPSACAPPPDWLKFTADWRSSRCRCCCSRSSACGTRGAGPGAILRRRSGRPGSSCARRTWPRNGSGSGRSRTRSMGRSSSPSR